MTEQDQIKALAELDGWKQTDKWRSGWIDTKRKDWIDGMPGILPDYLTSYDAIIPLMQKQTSHIKMTVYAYITGGNMVVFDFSSSQLCEALLRATGKWKD